MIKGKYPPEFVAAIESIVVDWTSSNFSAFEDGGCGDVISLYESLKALSRNSWMTSGVSPNAESNF